jgi:hypothetical protein
MYVIDPRVTKKIHLEFLIAASSSLQGQPGGLIATYIHISCNTKA